MAHDIFISHSARDKTIANAVCAKLEAKGIRCWIAPRDILPGEDWALAIMSAIKSSEAMILVFSADADRSPHILREVKAALDHDCSVVPFRIEDVKPSGAMEYHLGPVHWLDAIAPPMEERIDDLGKVIAAMVTKREEAQASVSPTVPSETEIPEIPEISEAPVASEHTEKVSTPPPTRTQEDVRKEKPKPVAPKPRPEIVEAPFEELLSQAAVPAEKPALPPEVTARQRSRRALYGATAVSALFIFGLHLPWSIVAVNQLRGFAFVFPLTLIAGPILAELLSQRLGRQRTMGILLALVAADTLSMGIDHNMFMTWVGGAASLGGCFLSIRHLQTLAGEKAELLFASAWLLEFAAMDRFLSRWLGLAVRDLSHGSATDYAGSYTIFTVTSIVLSVTALALLIRQAPTQDERQRGQPLSGRAFATLLTFQVMGTAAIYRNPRSLEFALMDPWITRFIAIAGLAVGVFLGRTSLFTRNVRATALTLGGAHLILSLSIRLFFSSKGPDLLAALKFLDAVAAGGLLYLVVLALRKSANSTNRRSVFDSLSDSASDTRTFHLALAFGLAWAIPEWLVGPIGPSLPLYGESVFYVLGVTWIAFFFLTARRGGRNAPSPSLPHAD